MKKIQRYIKWEWTEGEYTDLPAKFVVCPGCDGAGSLDNGGTPESYGPDYQASFADCTCPECDGRRVVLVLDEDKCDKGLLDKYLKHLREEAEYQWMCAQERLMGA